jgi:tetratricopeptide (TPR) repeat protein
LNQDILDSCVFATSSKEHFNGLGGITMIRRILVSFLSVFLVTAMSAKAFAQDAVTERFLNGLSGTQRDVAKIVIESVQQTGHKVVGIGSWLKKGLKYLDPLKSLPGGALPSDEDLRLVFEGKSPEAARVAWIEMRNAIQERVYEKFKDPKVAKKVLASINLYPPDQLLKGAATPEEALQALKELKINPNLSGGAFDGWFGQETEAARQAMEATNGRVFFRDAGGIVRSGFADIVEGESAAARSIFGQGNLSSQLAQFSQEFLQNPDAKKLLKNLERLTEAVAKGRSMGRVGKPSYLENLLKTLKTIGKIPDSEQLDYKKIADALANDSALFAEVEGAITKARLDAEALKILGRSGSALDTKFALELLEGGTKWGRFKALISTLAEHITIEAAVEFARQMVVWHAAEKAIDSYYKDDKESASQYSIAAVSGMANLPAALLMLSIKALLDDAKELGYGLAIKQQDCQELIAGIYEVKGREEVSEDQRIERSIDQLALLYTTKDLVEAAVAIHARNSATRNGVVDPTTAQKVYAKCAPEIVQRWALRREQLIADAAAILLSVEKALGPAMLIATVNPEPVILAGAAPSKGEANVNVMLDGDVAAITQAINRFKEKIRPLGIVKGLVQIGVKVQVRYSWLLDGREIAKEEVDFSGVGPVFQSDLARKAISLTTPGQHTIEFHYTLAIETKSTVDDVLAAKPSLTNTIEKKTTATIDAIDGNWSAKINGPDTGKVDESLTLSADLSPATRQLKKVTLRWTNETARMGLPGGESVSFTPREATPQQFKLEVFADVGGQDLLVATAAKTVTIEEKKEDDKKEEPPNPNAGKFSGTAPANWEGGNTPNGFVLTRKPAKIKAPCLHDSSVSASLEARFAQAAKPKDAAEASSLADTRFKARRAGDTPSDMAAGLFMAGGHEGVSAFSMGDYSGAIADFAIWMRPGSGGEGGYPASYFGANGIGDVVKQGGVISFSYHVRGTGCWDNSDRAYLVTQGAAAQEEARSILASLRLDDKGLIETKPYDGPKYDGSDLPKVVLVPAKLEKLKVGDTVTVEAVVENAKPADSPFTYNWGGTFDGKPETSKKSNTVRIKPTKPGKYRLSVSVDGARFGLGSASLEYEVADYRVKIERDDAANKPLIVGSKTGFKATLTVDGAPAGANFIYRWEPSTELNWAPAESEQAQAKAVFTKPGKTKVWVVVLEKKGEVLTTVAESDRLELDVTNPALKIAFAPETAVVGAQVKASVKTTPADIKEIDFRWELSSNAQLLNESQDAREITFIAKDTNPVQVTTRARVPVSGEDLGEATAKFTAKKFDVKVTVLGPQGPKPQVWKEGFGIVTVENAIAVHQNVTMRANVMPQVEGIEFRYEWTVNEDSHIVDGSISNEARFNRSQTGTCVATVVVRDQNGLELGRGEGTFSATISEEMMSGGGKKKEAADKVTKAKEIVRKGQLDEAIALAGDAATVDPTNTEAGSLTKQWKQERATIETQIGKTKQLMAEEKFPEASNELVVAKNLHGLYKPVLDIEKEMNAKWTAYESGVKDGVAQVMLANNDRNFKKALELAAALRIKFKLIPVTDKTVRDYEEWARTHEAEKERIRGVMKQGEAKFNASDYEGALSDFAQLWVNFDIYWNNNLDTEPRYYEKIRNDALVRRDRINVLMPQIKQVAENTKFDKQQIQLGLTNVDEVLKLQPNNADARRYRQMLAARLNEGSNKSSAATFIKQADDFYEKNNYQQALDVFNKALEADPNSAAAYAGRCLSKRGLNDNAGASADCDRALQLDPNNADAYRGRSMIKRGANDYQGALAEATRAVELAPGSYRNYLTRGLAKEGLKDWAGALADYNRALEINPNYAMSYYYRGRVRYEAKDYTSAITDYDRSIQINPDYAMSYFNRGRARHAVKDYAGALADYDHFIATNATDKAAFNNRGLVKERLGDTAGAIADYEKAISLDPNYETAKKNLVNVRAKLTAAQNAAVGSGIEGLWDTTIPGTVHVQLEFKPSGSGWTGRFFGRKGWETMADLKFDTATGELSFRRPLKDFGEPDQFYSAKVTGDSMVGKWNYVNSTGNQSSWVGNRAKTQSNAAVVQAQGPETITVPATTSAATSSRSILGNGQKYTLQISGVFSYWDSSGKTAGADALYDYRGNPPVLYSPLVINGKQLKDWIEGSGNRVQYRGDHVYTVVITGNGKSLALSILDPGTYSDNSGSLSVRIGITSGATPTSTPSPAPSGQEVTIFDSMNVYGVGNGPTAPATFTIRQPHVIASVMTYHWNDGRGTGAGTIALRDANGERYGPWSVTGTPGQGGVPNVNWTCAPNIEIPAGAYTIIDSEPATWSQNGQSGGRGIAVVKGYPTDSTLAPTPQPTPRTSSSGTVVVAIFENKSSDAVHIFVQGQTFGPDNKLAPGETRRVNVRMTPDGRIKFVAGRNGQVLATRIWDGDPSDTNRFPRVTFNASGQLLVVTGLR